MRDITIYKKACDVKDYGLLWEWLESTDTIASVTLSAVTPPDELVVFGESIEGKLTKFCLSGGVTGKVYTFTLNIVCTELISGAVTREACIKIIVSII